MTFKRYYLTKDTGIIKNDLEMWNYVGDPLNPNTTFDVGLIGIKREEVRMDKFGVYVERPLESLIND
jgi:hypothetical protein